MCIINKLNFIFLNGMLIFFRVLISQKINFVKEIKILLIIIYGKLKKYTL